MVMVLIIHILIWDKLCHQKTPTPAYASMVYRTNGINPSLAESLLKFSGASVKLGSTSLVK